MMMSSTTFEFGELYVIWIVIFALDQNITIIRTEHNRSNVNCTAAIIGKIIKKQIEMTKTTDVNLECVIDTNAKHM